MSSQLTRPKQRGAVQERKPEVLDAQLGETDNLEVYTPDISAVEAMTRGEVDIQVATAKRWPRSLQKAQDQAFQLATANMEVATSCIYKLPRGGKIIEGPSVRLAEIITYAWGNMRAQSRIIDENDKWLTAQAVAWDMEKNNAVGIEVRRRITDKQGRKFNDDMIVVASNAANSIAYRNAVFRVVPRAYVDVVQERIYGVLRGDIKTFNETLQNVVDAFGRVDVPEATIPRLVNKPSLKDISLDDIVTLRGIYGAIKDGEATLEQYLGSPAAAAEGKVSFGFQTKQQPAAAAKPEPEPAPEEKPAPTPKKSVDEVEQLAGDWAKRGE